MHKIIRVAALAAAVAVASAGPATAECVFAKLGELKVDITHGPPMVEIVANGRKGKLVIDTGAFSSYLTPAGAAAMGVQGPGQEINMRVVSSDGEIGARYHTLGDVVLGETFRVSRFGVLVMPVASSRDDTVVGSLGLDILAASDIEFDLANGRIAIFSTKDCAKQSLAYWGDNYSLATTRRPTPDRAYITTTVELNGRSLPAQIRTGWGVSAVDRGAAAAAGLRPDSPGVQPIGRFASADEAWIGTFESFAVGEERIKNVKLVFANLFSGMRVSETGSQLRQKIEGLPSIILGLDFLRAHRVLVANSQGKMYFSYNGGPVFARPPAAP